MTVISKTADLTKSINDTVKELVVTEASLTAHVTNADGYATTAATNSATAEGYRDTAATHAATAASALATTAGNVTFSGNPALSDTFSVTAVDVFVYDTSLDSDGGAWRKRCQHTSWYNEPLCGKWLGERASEEQARYAGASVGTELVDTANTAAAWVAYGSNTVTQDGSAIKGEYVNNASGAFVYLNEANGLSQNLEVGKYYRLAFSIKTSNGASVTATWNNGVAQQVVTETVTETFYKDVEMFVTPANTSGYLRIQDMGANEIFWIKDISVKEVTALNTATDGYYKVGSRFYKLNATSGVTRVYRGNRREFPAIAVIVCEGSGFTIYDGDDPSLPMWKSLAFPDTTWPAYYYYGNTKSVTALDGKILSSGGNLEPTNGGGLRIWDFILDRVTLISHSYGANRGYYTDNISFESMSSGTANVTQRRNPDIYLPVNGSAVNKCAITVSDDAPVDPSTGLPVPTIVAGCVGGTVIFKNDGSTVTDTSLNHSPNTVTLSFDNDKNLYLTAASNHYFKWAAPYDSSGAVEYGEFAPGSGTPHWISWPGTVKNYVDVGSVQWISHNLGLAAIKPFVKYAHINSDFHTGWLLKNTKLACISDTNTESINSTTNLVVNGAFDSDLSGWTGTNISWSNGAINCANGSFQQTVFSTSTPKQHFVIRWSQVVNSGTRSRLRLRNAANSGDVGSFNYYFGTGDFSTTVNTSQGLTLIFYCEAADDVTFDNIEVVEVFPERSPYSSYLFSSGNITKTAVNTGSQLVTYRSFDYDGTNYLYQPYNSGLDFGTSGDFSVIFWMKTRATIISNRNLFGRIQSDNTVIWRMQHLWNGTNNYLYMNGLAVYSPFSNDTWNCVAYVRKSGTLTAYVNGAEKASVANTTNMTGDSTTEFRISKIPNNGIDNVDLALLRIAASTPSADELKQIYQDELKLFQPGAQCTLYGSSNTVTSISHDPKTELLHVGTSAGRSVFDGLVRVSNTTDAVGVAISAVNNLIVEE